MYVAIPTYHRSDVLEKKTLHTLLNGGILPSQIYIFVANEHEQKIYTDAIPSNQYHSIVIGKLGIANQRIFIRHFFKENDYVISIDDDVEGLYKLSGDKLVQIKDIATFFKHAYQDLKREKKYLWGIYPVRNPFYMKHSVSKELSFVIGALHGYIVRHGNELSPHVQSEGKEDYEQSILYYQKDGGVIRYNDITIKTKFLAKGGLGENRFERNKKSAFFLKKRYPHHVTIFNRKNGMTEIRIHTRRKKDK